MSPSSGVPYARSGAPPRRSRGKLQRLAGSAQRVCDAAAQQDRTYLVQPKLELYDDPEAATSSRRAQERVWCCCWPVRNLVPSAVTTSAESSCHTRVRNCASDAPGRRPG
jgi:hypothetical protein